jgi:hypothetical protein
VARHGDLQTLAERKADAALRFEETLEEVAAARREMAAAEYDWSAACLALAGLQRDGPDTRRRAARPPVRAAGHSTAPTGQGPRLSVAGHAG